MPRQSLTLVLSTLCLISVLSESSLVFAQEIYRLSNTTKPTHYDIELTVDTGCAVDTFSGRTKITVQALRTTDTITLHTSTHIAIRTLQAFKEDASEIAVGNFGDRNDNTEIRTITLAENVTEGAKFMLDIAYEAKISTDKLGFYQSSYLNDDGEKVCLLSTQFAPTQARRAFPCYDEPGLKANYSIKIIHPIGTRALSNEVAHNYTRLNDEQIETIFNEVNQMPTYLVGFVISDFDYKEVSVDGIMHQAYSRKNAIDHVAFALSFASKVYGHLAEYFNMKLPLNTLKHIGIPEFYFSAMENWGMITYKESRFLFNPDLHPVNLEHSITNVIAHEVTHHWFGDLVTMKWWTHVWLKEGFATLFSYYGETVIRSEHEAMQFLLIEKLQFVFTIDSDPEIKPMSKYIEKQADIMANYDKIAYDKACCVLRMMEHAFTRPVFQDALRKYIKEYSYGNTEEDNLFKALQESLPITQQNHNVAEIMGSWTQQSGYPVLSVTIENYNIRLKQERFLVKKTDETEAEPTVWWIPVTFYIPGSYDVKQVWINQSDVTIACSDLPGICTIDPPFLVNYHQTGYYRVNYEENHWNELAAVLKSNFGTIPVNNRAQMIDDAFSLAYVGRLNYSTVYNLVEYISQESEYAPWAALARGLASLKQYLSGDSNFQQLKQYVQRIVELPYISLPLATENKSNFIRRFTHQVIVNMACEFGLEHCLKEQRDYSYPDLRQIYYCNKLRAGGNYMYGQLRNMLKTTTDPILRDELISSLGCSTDRNQLAVLLLIAVDKSENYMLTEAERIQLIQSIYRKSYAGVVETLNLLTNEDVKAVFRTSDVEKLGLDLAKYINSYELYIRFNNLMERLVTTSKFTEMKGIVRRNLWWIADYGRVALDSAAIAAKNSARRLLVSFWGLISCLFIVRYIH